MTPDPRPTDPIILIVPREVRLHRIAEFARLNHCRLELAPSLTGHAIQLVPISDDAHGSDSKAASAETPPTEAAATVREIPR
jgi:hypothetical protein